MLKSRLFIVYFCLFLASWPTGTRANSFIADAAPTHSEVCLATAMYHEARGEGWLGMVAVGYVVLNRAAISESEPCSIITARNGHHCQFTFTCRRAVIHRDDESWHVAVLLSRQIMSIGGIDDPTSGATFFAQCQLPSNDWNGRVMRIGGHCFWRSEPEGR